MLRIIDMLKEVADEIGLEQFYYGHIQEIAQLISADGKENIPHLPALFLPMDLRYTHPTLHQFGVKLDILIAVISSNLTLPTERFKSTMIELDELRAKFERALERKCDKVENIGGILRPKVGDAFNSNNREQAIFNEAMDGIEITCDIVYDDRIDCMAADIGIYVGKDDR